MPYDGLFLPYQTRWENLGPINGGLAQYNVTTQQMNSYYKGIQEAGFHSLSYFDIGNWGTRTDTNYGGPAKYCGLRPAGPHTPSPNGTGAANGPCPDPDGGNAYLRDVLWPALLHHGWSVIKGKFMVHKNDWVGTTDMDTQVPVFEDLIIEQAARHLTELPAFEGIAIDRLDYSQYFNYDTDDGISWVPVNCTAKNSSKCGNYTQWSWGKARALRLSYRHTYERLHQLLHGGDGGKGVPGNKLMLQNCNWLCRIDEFRAFDGSFSEGAALNSVAFTGLRAPTILWTYALSEERAVLDAYFQQHLLMNVYPMAPMPKNDHSIVPGDPNGAVELAYREYAPLFDAMHGARWLLTAHPAKIVGANTSSSLGILNVLTLPTTSSNTTKLPRLVVPIMLSAQAAVTLVLNLGPAITTLGWSAVTNVSLSARYPNASVSPADVSLGAAKSIGSGLWQATVPLQRGCAMVMAILL